MAPRLMHVDLDAFFVEVCRRHHPALRTVDHLVVGGRRDGRGVVQSCSYPCRALGVRSGMPVRKAAALCPQATFVQGDFAWYRAASRAVRTVLERHSPVVVMASLDEAYLDFTGTERLYPASLLPVAERVRDEVRAEAGLDVSVGIGPNRMVAKLASDAAKPRGLLEVREGWEAGFLAGLPLAAIPGVGPRTARRLADRGLTMVHEVQALPLAALERVLGDEAAPFKLRCHGHGGRSLATGRPPRSVSRETTLPADSTDAAALDRMLQRLVGHVASDLRERGLEARTVVVKLRHDDFVTVTRRRTLDRPTDLDAELVAAVRPLFADAFAGARARGRGVRLLGMAATGLVAGGPAELFEPPERTRRRELTGALDRVRDRFGFEAIRPASVIVPGPPPRPQEPPHSRFGPVAARQPRERP